MHSGINKMRFSYIIIAPLILGYSMCMAKQTVDPNTPISTKDKISYSLGVKTAENFETQEIDIDSNMFAIGLSDAVSKQKLKLSAKEIQDVIIEFQQQQISKMHIKEKNLAKENLVKSKDFLSKNKLKDGVQVTKSGLQYKVLTKGKGKSPKPDDYVTVNYRGTLIDGTEFDSSYRRNKATTFQLKGLISGWQEALSLMKPGDRWELVIPPELAYGDKSAGPVIKPNSTLIFEIELIAINSTKPSIQ